MRLSIHTDDDVKESNGSSGYSYSYFKIIEHFSKFTYNGEGMELYDNAEDVNVQLFYMEPERYNHNNMKDLREPDFKKFHDNQYKIQGTHLEATMVWKHWIEALKNVDEIWVGNKFAKDAIWNSGIETPTYVFELGIDPMWKPIKRTRGKQVKFLHVDSASPRKRADLTLDAFRMAFGNRDDVSLTMKYHQHENPFGINLSLNQNINYVYETLSQEEMVQLYLDHDVLLYPTEGEGFGFIPLQALATGMPVISTARWCSYKDLLGDNVIQSRFGKTQHTQYYEGEVDLADLDSLVYLMRKVVDNYDDEINYYFNQAPSVYARYNWQTRCDEFLESVVNRLGIKTFH